MDAVYQSNVGGTILNRPYRGYEANTETLPAYILSAWLFESEMRNATSYWITGLKNMNVTSVAYSSDTLLIQAVGNAGSSLTVANETGSHVYPIAGFETITFESGITTCWPLVLATIVIIAAIAGATIVIVRARRGTPNPEHPNDSSSD
jgi:hypothetical protein